MNLTFRPIVKLVVVMLCAVSGFLGVANAASEGQVRHFVAFKFKESASADETQAVVKSFHGLKKDISEVQSIEAGPNNSPENLNKGLTYAFLVTFANEKNRDIYLTHPAHLKFKDFAKPYVSDVLVIDFTNKNLQSN